LKDLNKNPRKYNHPQAEPYSYAMWILNNLIGREWDDDGENCGTPVTVDGESDDK